MTETDKLLVRIGTARDAISRKTEQTSLDYMIDGVLMNCSVMLKEQDAVKPCLMQDAKGIWNTCGKCGHILKSALLNPMDENDTFFFYPKFCSECGRAVKWE